MMLIEQNAKLKILRNLVFTDRCNLRTINILMIYLKNINMKKLFILIMIKILIIVNIKI
jgi:hypothetical protein